MKIAIPVILIDALDGATFGDFGELAGCDLCSGPIRGFAVVHCLGIMTSMFSAVFVSRGMVAVIYGGRKRLEKISIGQVWKPST